MKKGQSFVDGYYSWVMDTWVSTLQLSPFLCMFKIFSMETDQLGDCIPMER